MRVVYILLIAVTTILASSEAHTHVAKLSSNTEVKRTNAIPANRRYLRDEGNTDAYEDDEERATNTLTTLDDLFKLDDLLAAKNLDKSVDKKELAAKGQALFKRMSTHPTVKGDILKRVSESDDSTWFKALWHAYLWGKARRFEAKEIAAARRNHPRTS